MMVSTKGRYALRVLIDLAEHQTDTGLSNFTFKNTFIVLVMEQADVTCTGLIQPVFQRNIIDKRFYVISSIGTGRNFTSQHYLKTIVKETLGIAETVVRPLTTGIRIIMIFYSPSALDGGEI